MNNSIRLMASLIPFWATGCADNPSSEPVEQIEMRISGWSSLDVVIDADGKGSFEASEPFPEGKNGSFQISRGEFLQVLEKLEPYRDQSEEFSDESITAYIDRRCPEGIPAVTDAGAFYVRWKTEKSDRHFLVDFGCDYERYADRNSELRAVVDGLPIEAVG